MAGLWLKWVSTALCLTGKPLSATWVICWAPAGAVTVPLLPDVVWPGGSSGNSCLSQTRHVSPRIRGKVYEACVHSAMLHGRETWGPNHPNCSGSAAITVRWSVGSVASETRDEPPSASLLQKFGIEDITSVLCCRRLRWHDHVKRAMSCIKSITNFPIPGTRKKGRPGNTWSECVKTDINKCGLAGIDSLDRDTCRAGVRHRTGHGQLLNLNLDGWMDGWVDSRRHLDLAKDELNLSSSVFVLSINLPLQKWHVLFSRVHCHCGKWPQLDYPKLWPGNSSLPWPL